MLKPDQALSQIFEHVKSLPGDVISLQQAVGFILAKNLYARDNLPPFDNSAMDGYAVRLEDLSGASREKPVHLKVQDVIRAGTFSEKKILPNQAVKIMTGAPVPPGTDAVIMIELTSHENGHDVKMFHTPQKGENIRNLGEDIRSGQLLLKQGTFLRPYEVALLASQGYLEVPVVRKPKVSIIATGDELVDPSETPAPGTIRNSNGPALQSAITRWDITADDLGIVRDDPSLLEKKIREALNNSDVLLISGGVSVGEFDYTKSLLEKLGMKEIFWKVAIKPGKPLLFGIYDLHQEGPKVERPKVGGPKVIFGLPGNPISVLVCLEEFVRPALEKMQGYVPKYPSYHLQGKVLNDYTTPQDRQQYLFCQVTSNGKGFELHIIKPQGSAMMGMACQANALAISPIGINRVHQGDTLFFRWLK